MIVKKWERGSGVSRDDEDRKWRRIVVQATLIYVLSHRQHVCTYSPDS